MGLIKKIKLTKEEKKYLLNKKTITVHNESSWAPYNFNENNIPKGLIIDYLDLIAKKLGLNIQYISGYSWNEFLSMLKVGKLDVIANIAYNKERAKYISFTTPFMTSKKAIFSNIAGIQKIADLNGKTVAVPSKFYIHDYLKHNYPKIKLKAYKNVKECLFAVVNKEVDALIENYAVINYLIRKNGLEIKYITIKDDKELSTKISFGVSKDQKILRDILQKGQQSITKKEFEELENKWFGIDKNKELFTQKEKEYLKKKKYLKICTNPNWAPIEFWQNNKPKGIAIDIINIISEKISLEPIFIHSTSWKESQEFLKRKKCDILSSAIYTKERQKYANFTKQYLSYDLAIIAKNDKPLVRKLHNIINKTMVRREASGISTMLKSAYPNLVIKDTPDMIEAFKQIKNNQAYFSVSTLPVFAYSKKREDLDDLQVIGYTDLKCNLKVAVRDDDRILLGAINKAIDTIPPGTIKIINDKWTSMDVIKKEDYTLAVAILIISLVIVFTIIVAYKKQKKLKDKIAILNNSLKNRVEQEIQKNKEKEKLMLYQNRFAQMGEMIIMIAHQWRQPLNILSMLNQALFSKYKKKKIDNEFMDYFEKASTKQIQTMSQTISDFLDFFKPQKKKTKFNINQSIKNTIDIIKPICLKMNIDIVFEYTQTFQTVGYPNELGQVFLSILNNAKDALVQNNVKNKKIKILLYREQNDIVIKISDNAGGIKEDIMSMIFEPYFSTKKEGTGLGLYIVKIIIQNHQNGSIKAYNNKEGAVFEIRL